MFFLYQVIAFCSGESPFVQIQRVGFSTVIAGMSLVTAYFDGEPAIQTTSMTNAMLLFATAPFMAAVLGWICLSENVRIDTWISIIIAVVGIYIMVSDKSGSSVFKGGVAAMGSAFGFAILTVVLRWGKSAEMLPAVFCLGYSL